MRTIRALITLAAFTLTTLAFAQAGTTWLPAEVRDVFAYEMDAIVTDCPASTNEFLILAACLRLDSGQDLVKVMIESVVAGFTDIRWVNPWAEGNAMLLRGAAVTNRDGTDALFIIVIDVLERFVTRVWFAPGE